MRATSAAGVPVTEAEEGELRAEGERPEEQPAAGAEPEAGQDGPAADEAVADETVGDELEEEPETALLELAGGEALEEPGPAASGDEPGGDDEAEAGPGPGDRLDDEELLRGVTALVFASPEPIPLRRIVQLLEGPRSGRVRGALTEIARRLDEAGLPLELREIAGGWHFMTAPESYPTVSKLSRTRRAERLSAAGLETLAVIAYRQPVTKAEIEAIRGVQCGAMLRTLVDRGLVRVTGRATQPGSPLQYGTTRAFLDRFGLASLQDLPRDGELLGE